MAETIDLANIVKGIASQGKEASHALSIATTEAKNKALEAIAQGIEAQKAYILEQNAIDIKEGEANGLSEALLDRLRFDDARIAKMAEGVRQVIKLPDPVGEVIETLEPENGLDIRKTRVPIGVIGIIYESRPNVTIDCAALCLKSGNAAILRGGKEAFHSNTALASIITEALRDSGLPEHCIQLIPTTDRSALNTLLKLDAYIHCIIPRGGEGLIRFVAENATIPVIKHYDGICNIYIDADADIDLARKITINAKCQRPGVCNAAENLMLHRSIAPTLLPLLEADFKAEGVELRGDEATQSILPNIKAATEEDFRTEYLDRILSIMIVDSTHDAIKAVNRYGSGHSDAIITRNESEAALFMNGVDAATVYWNASTRFTDGFEFGFGAEIGISTDRLHARGPMGLRELCTYKFLIYGQGQTK